MGFHVIGIEQTTNHVLVGVMVAVLSYLMVSRVRFRSMKDLRLTKRTLAVIGLLITCAIVVGVRISQPAVLFFLVGCYIVLGIGEEILLVRRSRREARRAAAHAAKQQNPAQQLSDDPDPDDTSDPDDERDVLAELGVDDEPERASA